MQTKDVIFKLSLEEAGVMTTCEIASLYCEDFDEVTRTFQLNNKAHSDISVSDKSHTLFLS